MKPRDKINQAIRDRQRCMVVTLCNSPYNSVFLPLATKVMPQIVSANGQVTCWRYDTGTAIELPLANLEPIKSNPEGENKSSP